MDNKQKLLIATRSQGKFPEIVEKLKDLPFKFLNLNDFYGSGFSGDLEVRETAMTFEGNAIIKAVTYGLRLKCLTLADDSGLEVDALGGRPGILSARYTKGSDQDRYQKVLEEMKDVPDEKRTARFKCVLAIFNPEYQMIETRDGTVEGIILREPKGKNGFGYDPIFFIPTVGKTLAEITAKEKSDIDHRGQALEKMKKVLTEMI